MALSSSHWIVTEAEFRRYISAGGADQAANIQSAIKTATTYMERRLGRDVVSRGSLTEYHTIPFRTYRHTIRLLQFPLLSVTSIHESVDTPRVYDSTTLLVAGTDYITNTGRATVTRISSSECYPWRAGLRAIKVIYTAGWAQVDVPDELKQLCLFASAAIYKEASLQRWNLSAATDAQGNYQRFLGYFPPDMIQALDAYRCDSFSSTGEAA